MMAAFDRFKPSVNRSFALRAFNLFETELNQHFWSFKVVSEYAGFIARNAKKTNALQSTASIFQASGPDARRIPATVSDWLKAQVELENWLRLSALVSAAAFHEAYLRQIIRSALMASPMARVGQPRLIDGVTLLKSGAELNYDSEIISLTRGDWQARSAAFDRLFGSSGKLLFPIADLEDIRKFRNDFAHGFGRDLNIPEPSVHTIALSARLGQPRFVQLMGVLSKNAKLVDKYLLVNIIGDFEMVHAFHTWMSDNASRFNHERELARSFQAYSHASLGASRSSSYCNELANYYKNL